MTGGWRKLLGLGEKEPRVSVSETKAEPVWSKPPARDESVDRMNFQLSLRKRGISDQRVLRAMDAVPREAFVLPELAADAYADQAMPIACGQTISQPYVVAYMTEQLDVKREHRVLEIGTGSGYQAAILSQLAGVVITVERYRTLAETARERLAALRYDNVTVIVGDGLAGCPAHAPYDRIIVTAAAETVPQALVDELVESGIMILPLGEHGGVQRLVKLTKGKDGLAQQDLIGVRFVPALPGQAREL